MKGNAAAQSFDLLAEQKGTGIKMTVSPVTTELLEFIKKGTSPFHVVQESAKKLEDAGFQKLSISQPWNLLPEGAYYTTPYDTSLFAFRISKEINADTGFRIEAAHTDSPCPRIKQKAELTEKKYLKVNTEMYGSAILNTWLDRPLSFSGKVSLKSDSIFHPRQCLIDMERPIFTIPNLAVHMNPEVNKGIELNKQTDMIPFAGLSKNPEEDKEFLINLIAAKLEVEKEEILGYDLYVYNCEEGMSLGLNNEFVSAPRLDNLTSSLACLKGILNSSANDSIQVIALFDNEEIGSRTKQGADSAILSMVLEKILAGVKCDHIYFYESLLRSILLSVDVGHAVHPNRPEKSDAANHALLGGGVVFKIDSSQRYVYDTDALAKIHQLCIAKEIPFQKFSNRSDIAGGGTLGSLLSAKLPMPTIDLGVPLLAMHSARELMCGDDQNALEQLLFAFLQTN